MSIKEIKEQIHLLTTVKLILEIDNRCYQINIKEKNC